MVLRGVGQSAGGMGNLAYFVGRREEIYTLFTSAIMFISSAIYYLIISTCDVAYMMIVY